MTKNTLKTIPLALAILFAAATTASPQGAIKWSTLSPEKGGFTLRMPGEPKEQIESKQDFTFHMYTVATEGAFYLAGYGDYAPTVRLNVEGELAANRDNFVKGLDGAKLLTSQSTTLDSHPGLEFTGESPQGRFRSRVYLVGNRVFQILAFEFAGKDDSENVKRFLASFAFTPQP